MFGRRKLSAQKVVVHRPLVLDQEFAPKNTRLSRERKTHAVLDVVEELMTIATASLVLFFVLQLPNIMGHSEGMFTPHNIVLRPAVSRLMSGATGKRADGHNDKMIVAGTTSKRQAWSCSGHTLMNIVAHEDDDLLFINPDIAHAIQQHYCVRTVYVTAGDDGRGQGYLLSREAGSEAAYSTMLGISSPWQYQKVMLTSGATIVTASPQGHETISLVFLRLPDGNLDGKGFAATGYESITKLHLGVISDMTSIDGQAKYTSSQLTATLEALMKLYTPTRIYTQADDIGLPVADHSDHITAGQYTTAAAFLYAAYQRIDIANLVQYFMGYPIRSLSSNLSPPNVVQKSAAFFAYAVHDPGVCTSIQECLDTGSSYGLYLSREYSADQ